MLGKQALNFLQQNRISRVDTSRHLNILLNCEAFPALEIADNAKLLLKFVKMSERINLEAEKLKQQKEIPRMRQGMKTTMSSKGYSKGILGTNPHTTFNYENQDTTGSNPLSPASSAAHISQIYNRGDMANIKTAGNKSQLS